MTLVYYNKTRFFNAPCTHLTSSNSSLLRPRTKTQRSLTCQEEAKHIHVTEERRKEQTEELSKLFIIRTDGKQEHKTRI